MPAIEVRVLLSASSPASPDRVCALVRVTDCNRSPSKQSLLPTGYSLPLQVVLVMIKEPTHPSLLLLLISRILESLGCYEILMVR